VFCVVRMVYVYHTKCRDVGNMQVRQCIVTGSPLLCHICIYISEL
jgi:hypothetical protein